MKLFLLLILDSIILQPLRLVLGFLLNFTWFPSKVQPPIQMNKLKPDKDGFRCYLSCLTVFKK